MDKKTVLLLITLVILTGAPLSMAKPQYLASLNEVYGSGSCGTCHVNDTRDGARTPYGTSFEDQPGHAANASGALRAIGAPPATPNLTTATETQKSPGFGIIVSAAGLLASGLMIKRK